MGMELELLAVGRNAQAVELVAVPHALPADLAVDLLRRDPVLTQLGADRVAVPDCVPVAVRQLQALGDDSERIDASALKVFDTSALALILEARRRAALRGKALVVQHAATRAGRTS